MPLLPSRVKFRKQHTRRHRYDHVATSCNTLAFGDYGIQALVSGEISARQIEAARVAAMHYMGRVGKMWIRIFPHQPVGRHAAETRMGSGKGEVAFWATHVNQGTVMFEFGGVNADMAREALRRMSFKLPIKTRMVVRSATP
jgi:large subunit ribosomal protein L16